MGAHSPGANAQDIGDNLVGVTVGNHAHNFLLSRTEPDGTVLRAWQANEQIPASSHLGVQQDLFPVGGSIDRTYLRSCFQQTHQRPDYFVDGMGPRFASRFRQCWAGPHWNFSGKWRKAVFNGD